MSKKQIKIPAIDDREVHDAMDFVERAFGLAWLADITGTHKLQKLWRRSDSLANIELMCLGDSLRILEALDAKWVQQRVTSIQQDDATCHGPLFEVLGLATLVRGGMSVRPLRGNTPGIDGIVSFPDGFEVRLSLRNHDVSSHESYFREQSRHIRAVSRRAFGSKTRAYQLIIESLQALSPSEWKILKRALEQHSSITRQPSRVDVIPGKVGYAVNIVDPFPGFRTFSAEHLSDTFICVSAQHRNEQKGFRDKVHAAAANMRRNASRTGSSANLILMRLHPSASLNEIEAEATAILNEDEDPGVDAILLYQSSVTREGDQSTVTHHMRFVGSARWDGARRPLSFVTLIGMASTAQSRQELRFSDGRIMDLERKYLYQAGDHYYQAHAIEGGWTGKPAAIAAGIMAHVVFSEPAPGMTITGRFPPDEELIIL